MANRFKFNSKVIAKTNLGWKALTITKPNKESFQAEDAEGNKYRGLSYRTCYFPDEFKAFVPEEFDRLFGKKETVDVRDAQFKVGDRVAWFGEKIYRIKETRNFGEKTEYLLENNEGKGWAAGKDLRSLTCVAESAQDSRSLDSNLDSTSLDCAKSIDTVKESLVLDIPVYPSVEMFDRFRDSLLLASSVVLLPALPSLSEGSDSEPTTKETVSPQSSNVSQQYSRSISALKMSPDYYLAHTDQAWGKEAISGVLCGSYTSSGTMQNGKLSPQHTLEAPGLGEDCLSLASPTALSSTEGRPPGLTKLEADLKEMKALAPGEVCNPEFLESASGLVPGWTDPADSRTASEFLQEAELSAIVEKPVETHLTQGLQKLPCAEFSTLSQLESLIKDGFIPISAIECLEEMQPRFGLTAQTVETYQTMLEHSEPPPLVVFKISDRFILTQGFHRLQAAKNVGREIVKVEIVDGSLAEAQLNAAAGNAYNGLQLSPEEKRRACQMYLNALEDLPDGDSRKNESARSIAKKVGCGSTLVAKIRRENLFCARCAALNLEEGKTRFKHKELGALGTYVGLNNLQMGVQLEWDLGVGRDRFSNWIPLDDLELTDIPKPNAINGFAEAQKAELVTAKSENTKSANTKSAQSTQELLSTDSDEQYTPKYVYKIGLEMLKDEDYDLDPCTNDKNSPNVPCVKGFSKKENGLICDWNSYSVWLNPPYSNPGEWVEKAIAEYEAGNIEHCFILVSSDNSTKWYQKLLNFPVCLIDHRIKFINPDNASVARFASSLFYLGDRVSDFIKYFDTKCNQEGLGTVVSKLRIHDLSNFSSEDLLKELERRSLIDSVA